MCVEGGGGGVREGGRDGCAWGVGRGERAKRGVGVVRPRCFSPLSQVTFDATRTLCEVEVVTVLSAQSGAPVKYGSRTQLVTDGYHVE